MRDTWQVRDFVLIWLSGLAGGLLFGSIGFTISDEWSIVLALAGGMGANLVALAILYRRKTDPGLGLQLEFRDLIYLSLGFGVQLGLAILLEPLARSLMPEGGPAQDVAQELIDPEATSLTKIAIVVAAVMLAPVVEELVFRGVLIKALKERSRQFIVVVTAAVFAGVHLLTLTEPFLVTAVLVIPPLFILGMLLSWMTLRSGRLGPAILTHTGFNAVSALILFIPPEVIESLNR